jgi:C-terminal processing protease CtpA/Prc
VTDSRKERGAILGKVDLLVRTKFFDLNFNGRNWPALMEQHRASIVEAASSEEFEQNMVALLKELGTSHTGFFRRESKIASRNSVNATFRERQTDEGARWAFQDVQPGGPAANAGIKPGDILLEHRPARGGSSAPARVSHGSQRPGHCCPAERNPAGDQC